MNGIGVFYEEVSTKALLVAGRHEMVKADKSLLELLWRIVVKPREDDGENCGEILLNSGADACVSID